MKTTTIAAAALALVGVATADILAINNPTVGSTWSTADNNNFIGWTGTCSFMGNASRSVLVDLMKGPSGSLQFVASLQPLDCSSEIVNRANVTLPSDIPSGNYSIRIQTTPPSYSNVFAIVNPKDKPTTTAGPAPTQNPKPPAAGAMLEPKIFLAMAGTAVAAAFQYLL
ncbi:hypothetical protein DFQ27_008699 [Actinomortierella ambigua]|uniref:Secreted protein n=1 Tax=Actinomortierella ambigua TaxID=1343610 RepID=A0A9P6PT61_9FUNG|nr:hypothetical protein DFQ27_008699 [Actinomortierella ambigua]